MRSKGVNHKRVKSAPLTATKKKSTPGTFTPQKRAEFLDLYSTGDHSVDSAAAQIGISKITVFKTKRRDPAFCAQFVEAQDALVDGLEDRLLKFATGTLNGYKDGNIVAIFGLLKARRPSVWRDNHRLEGEVKVSHSFSSVFAAAMAKEIGVGDDTQQKTH